MNASLFASAPELVAAGSKSSLGGARMSPAHGLIPGSAGYSAAAPVMPAAASTLVISVSEPSLPTR